MCISRLKGTRAFCSFSCCWIGPIEAPFQLQISSPLIWFVGSTRRSIFMKTRGVSLFSSHVKSSQTNEAEEWTIRRLSNVEEEEENNQCLWFLPIYDPRFTYLQFDVIFPFSLKKKPHRTTIRPFYGLKCTVVDFNHSRSHAI